MKVNNLFNTSRCTGYVSDLASQTIPDQSFTIRELMSKFTYNGIADGQFRDGEYDDENVSVDDEVLSYRNPNYDMSDIQTDLENTNKRINEAKTNLAKRQEVESE